MPHDARAQITILADASSLTRRRFGTGALAALASAAAAGGLGGCGGGNGKQHVLRSRLRLDVQTPDGYVSGAGVVQVALRKTNAIGAGPSLSRALTGQAIVVDLGQRGSLFCLLKADPKSRSSRPAEEWFEFFLERREGLSFDAVLGIAESLRAQEPRRELKFDELPMLVRFRDINDPKTVERVDPNNLAEAFGQGVRLARASIEITNDPVTTGIEKKLGWWNGPFPWLKPLGNGVYVDTRTEALKATKDQFQQGVK